MYYVSTLLQENMKLFSVSVSLYHANIYLFDITGPLLFQENHRITCFFSFKGWYHVKTILTSKEYLCTSLAESINIIATAITFFEEKRKLFFLSYSLKANFEV